MDIIVVTTKSLGANMSSRGRVVLRENVVYAAAEKKVYHVVDMMNYNLYSFNLYSYFY